MKKLFLLILFLAVIVLGIFILRKNPEDQLKKIVYPSEFRVMTYNIHHGVGNDGMYSLSRIVRVIREHAPHIVCLNEVDYKTERTYRDDQARILAAELGMEFTFARNLPLQGGWYGNAILSKYPIYFSENKILSKRDGDEPRGALHTIISVNNQKLHVYGTHLSTDSLSNSAELKELLNHALDWGLDEPTIIAGDLNTPPGSKQINDLTYYFYDIGALAKQEYKTYPSANPEKRIDYIFMNDKLVPFSVQTIENDHSRVASDHLPVVAKFRIK
ncbi:MAG: endonuclease/exonuclease/phosphatase family protein [Candidatus Marinimicrobia bacterium]|nr:endonuclease/exonuclease/phosphatase family protein [Candidatus Neomarinimicrobiota bacterium]